MRRRSGASMVQASGTGGAVVSQGDTRDGHPIAELRPLPRRPLQAALLLQRWQSLPTVDPAKLRADLDDVLDPALGQNNRRAICAACSTPAQAPCCPADTTCDTQRGLLTAASGRSDDGRGVAGPALRLRLR
jgi:hypothetical protein